MNNSQLDKRLRAANPVPGRGMQPTSGFSTIRRVGQIILAVLSTLLVGVGVAWAASGTNPIASVFSDDLVAVQSETGFDSFEILKPITEEDLAALPRGAAMAARFHSMTMQVAENVRKGLPPFGPEKSRFDPDPAFISAFGQGVTNTGNPVTLLVEGDRVCSYAGEEGFGPGDCGDLESIAEGMAFSWGSQGRFFLELTGLFNDDVAAVDVLDDGKPPIEIPNNVLELRNLRYQDITLIGLDDQGNELFRNQAPLSMKP